MTQLQRWRDPCSTPDPVLTGTQNRRLITTSLKNVVVFLTVIASSLAAAQAVPTIGLGGAEEGEKSHYRGTSVSYGTSLTAYNYTNEVVAWTHRIGLMPEWHFNNDFHVRSRFFISQELTVSDTTNTRHEIELSDLWLDGVWGGWREKNTGIKIAADVRVTLPTSKTSWAASRLFTLGPGVNVSKSFKVLGGLAFIYSARATYRFNRFTTRQNAGGLITNCAGLGVPEACINTATGSRNIQFDIIHGPTISFSPHERLNISGTFLLQHGYLSPLSAVDPKYADAQGLQLEQGSPDWRNFAAFSLGVTYTPWDPVSFTLGAFTFANQLDTTGQYIFPLFNRNTVVSLDATFDIEATVTSLTKEKK